MGLEYSTRPELNQYEAQNHAANIKMWLHDFVDGAIVPSIVSLENIFKAIDSYFGITVLGGINFKATAAYDWTSTHDDDFFELQNDVEALDSRVDTLEASAGGGIIGEIRMWPAAAAPSKWMLCQGQVISRSSYAALFAVLGETFGIGDGETTFNLPDFRGRSPIGAGQGSGLTNRDLAGFVGEEAHANTSVENGLHAHTGPSHSHPMPHTHTGPSHSHPMPHAHTGGTHNHPIPHTHPMPHTHNISMYGMQSPYTLVSATGSSAVPQGTVATGASSATNTGETNTSNTGQGGDVTTGGTNTANTSAAGTGNTGASSTTNTSAAGTGNTGASSTTNTSAAGTGDTGTSGIGAPHNNMQPSLGINFIIYTGI